eukprot:1159492-Pelagomonas_calceolata.AAC.3
MQEGIFPRECQHMPASKRAYDEGMSARGTSKQGGVSGCREDLLNSINHGTNMQSCASPPSALTCCGHRHLFSVS